METETEIKIKIKGLSFGYEKDRAILKNITMQAKGGESIGLIGANGVGKSTLLKLLVGLNLSYSGTICVGGLSVEKKNLPAIREKTGYVFQDSESQLFMNTVYEDVAFAPRNFALDKAQIEARVNQAMALTGIEHLRDRQIYKLSGGEKKLVSIATILSMKPDIILLDEPSIALDAKNRRKLIGILNSLDCLKIIASHDLDMVLDTCGRTILMADGQIIADGATRELLTNQELLETYDLELPFCMQR